MSALDIELLVQDLPGLAQTAVTSPIYAGQQGQFEYRSAGDASQRKVIISVPLKFRGLKTRIGTPLRETS